MRPKARTGNQALDLEVNRLHREAVTHLLTAKMLAIHLKALSAAFSDVEPDAAAAALRAIERSVDSDIRGVGREVLRDDDADEVIERVVRAVRESIAEAQQRSHPRRLN